MAQSVSVVNRYIANFGKSHWKAFKWILRYLKEAFNIVLTFNKGEGILVFGYVNSEYAGDFDRRRSITGYIFTLVGHFVSWKLTLQLIIALSIIEAKYMKATEAAKEAIWLKDLVAKLTLVQL